MQKQLKIANDYFEQKTILVLKSNFRERMLSISSHYGIVKKPKAAST